MSDIQELLMYTREEEPYTEEWGSETIKRLVTPKLSDYFRTYRPHGLTMQTVWMVANVMDDDGNKYDLLRAYYIETSSLVMASQEGVGMDSHPTPIFQPGEMFLGRIFHEMDEEKGHILIKPLIPVENYFSLVVRPQHVSWKDAGGKLDLEFKAMAPALEFYIPGAKEDFMYRSEQGYVEGTLNGKKVVGWGNLDMAFGPPGTGFTQSKIYRFLEEQWTTFINIYEDGSKEGGIFINGVDKFQVGFFYKDGVARVAENYRMEVEYTEDRFIKGASVKLDELEFQFVTESKIAKAVAYVTWASGRMINKNETRKPVKSFAWFEFFPPKK